MSGAHGSVTRNVNMISYVMDGPHSKEEKNGRTSHQIMAFLFNMDYVLYLDSLFRGTIETLQYSNLGIFAERALQAVAHHIICWDN